MSCSNSSYEKIPEDVRATFIEIADNWGTNLFRLINDEFERCQRKFKPVNFEPVGIAEDEKFLRMNNVRLCNWPNLKLLKCAVDFKNVHLNLEFECGALILDGECYSITSEGAESYEGIFKFSHDKKLQFKVFVGMVNDEDSFVPTTYFYDIEFNSSDIKVVSECGNELDEEQLQEFISQNITSYLHSVIKDTVDCDVVGFSYSELFNDEPEEMTKYQKERMSGNLQDILETLKKEEPEIHAIPFEFCLEHEGFVLVVSADEVPFDFKLLHRGENDSFRVEDGRSYYCSNGDICKLNCTFNITCDKNDISKTGTFIVRPLRTKIFLGFEPASINNPVLGHCHVREITDLEVEQQWSAEPEEWVMDKVLPFMKTFLRTYASLLCSAANEHYEKQNK